MQELLKTSGANAQPTQQIGKVNIDAAREALAHLMDALRMMQEAGVKVSPANILANGKMCALPVIAIPEHTIGISVMEVMERGKSVKKHVFTTDGVSVMEALPSEPSVIDSAEKLVMEEKAKDDGHGQDEETGHGKADQG